MSFRSTAGLSNDRIVKLLASLSFLAGAATALRGVDNIYTDSARQREHDSYIHQQTERNTRYFNNADSYPKVTFAPLPQPSSVNYSHELAPGPQVHMETREEHFAAALKLGQRGNAAALREAATCYYGGYGVGQNKAEAYALYCQAAAKDGESAMYAASLVSNGDGVPQDREQGIAWLRQGAKLGDATCRQQLDIVLPSDAQADSAADKGDYTPMKFLMMDLLAGSHGRPKDETKALGYMERMADAGVRYGTMYLADAYRHGDGVPKDLAKAEKYYAQAEAEGEEEAAYWRASVANEATPTHPRDAAAAEERLAHAQAVYDKHPTPHGATLLGVLANARKDFAAARTWLQRAVDGGDMDYEGMLGILQWYGMGGPVEDAAGLKHVSAGADRGDSQANFTLGLAYEQGWHGLKQDYARATQLFEVAAAGGELKAQTRLAWNYYSGVGTPVSYEKALHWAELAAASDEGTALYVLGLCYTHGSGVPTDTVKGLHYMEAAAEHGESDAYAPLALVYFAGQVVPKNYDKAARWSKLAAEAGESKSMYMVGMFYQFGGYGGVPKDYAKCLEWMEKAAALGDDQAMRKLALYYQKSDVVPPDAAKSLEWMKKAAAAGNDQAKEAMAAGFTGN